ncbi:hypothetical protein PR202_ga21439 [Eleusine coracana subsp. coracana]|uniref:DUF4220 domain-containing protein n=1 Tax=Eleusine coracana subsp. coracana TaxID=191504 RepID=A0AAV5CZZ1_ELECO|nr:hypothetical protein PR202_ga21439 [Eleusine coracana subsp. coracana]
MIELSYAMQLWEEWQLRALVLSSAFLQLFLFCTASTRPLHIWSLLRSCIWLAYLSSDTLAIYALATLFNRHRAPSDTDGSGQGDAIRASALEVLWAPVLLVHLGGPVSISAYNMEDNELWGRHILTLFTQTCHMAKMGLKEQAYALVELHKFKDISVEDYVQEAKICIQTAEGARRDYHNAPHLPYSGPESLLLADRLIPYSRRLSILRYFLEFDESQRTFFILDFLLAIMFHLLYTKGKLLTTLLGSCLFVISVALSCAAIWLFAKAYKDNYNYSDVIVTYILLCLIAALEAFQICLLGCAIACQQDQSPRLHAIPVAQHNIISFVLRKKRPTKLMMPAALIGCDAFVNKHCHVRREYSGHEITKLVHGQLEQGWKEYIYDAASFRKFNDRRGQWTLDKHKHLILQEGRHRRVLHRSVLKASFDESVVLWHIATDLCFHQLEDASASSARESTVSARRISNYMAYLLLLRPEMLMPGAREDLFVFACNDIENMLIYDDEPPLDEGRLAQGIVRKLGQLHWLFEDSISPLLREACRLAEALMQIRDDKGRWKLIEGVWVEMLCYYASRCRGYLHAKMLGHERELLSYVWLLLSHMGMETVADRFHMPELSVEVEMEEDEIDGGGSTRPTGSTTSGRQQVVSPITEEITIA